MVSFCTLDAAFQLCAPMVGSNIKPSNKKGSCRSTCREGLLIRVAFWKKVEEVSRGKSSIPPSSCLFAFGGKWLMFAWTLVKENLSSTILDIGLHIRFLTEEREEIKVRKHTKRSVFSCKVYKEVSCHCHSNDFHPGPCCPQHDR